MSNEDKRRRQDGSTTRLSVAELLARREAETQPVPVVPEAGTVRIAPVAPPLSGRELHITELLRREGHHGEENRGGLAISRLVAIASGGVVLCGSVAFGASQWLSSPDERPLAEVRFDTRPAAHKVNDANSAGEPGIALHPQPVPITRATEVAKRRPAPRAGSATQAPGTATQAQLPTGRQETTVPTPTVPPQPPADTPPSPEPKPPTPAPIDIGIGPIDIGLDLGLLATPLDGFDFFAPA